ncbi:uncharacterized protein LOC124437863 [Xenia sp. Carnegie-2017]|uniref:uncharacterized protein LOC124437863 n=1 Tax=Xenia sp. Carnegie-2017 TaxID=2897299 RepID=UPI001F0483A2|nr:uncharacterized protein LOC124437863 [Xenia sp. Carnegie-2017]
MGKLWSKLFSNNKLRREENDLIQETENVLKDKIPDWLFYKDQVDKWNINIALVGSSQSGKSSFINTVIGLKPNDKGAAPVGISETEIEPTEYSHPKIKNIKFWDLPGIGTPENPDLKTYCKNIGGLKKYDAFLIFSKSRFTNRERQLAETILKRKLKNNCLKNLKDLRKDKTDLYLIDARSKKYDFERLREDVCEKLFLPRLELFLHCFNDKFYNKSRFKLKLGQGKRDLDTIYEDLIESWRKVHINFAITGDSGTGKSSFINAVRGVKANENGAAPVGVTETTSKAYKYSHPKNENIIFWDLPGIGTPTYPNLDEYCKKIGCLEKYDAFLIFCKTRFTNDDKELAEKVSSELKKPFFFIRTNVDYDVKNAKEDEGGNFDEESVLEIMRKDCLQNLKGLIDDKNDIYMIDNKAQDGYDFQRLKESIAEYLPDEKRKHFADSLAIATHAIIKLQANLLREQALVVTHCLSLATSSQETTLQWLISPVLWLLTFIRDKVVTHCLSFAASLLETTLQWLICPVLWLFTFIKDKVVTRCLSFAASLLETTLQWLICPVLWLFTFIKDKVVTRCLSFAASLLETTLQWLICPVLWLFTFIKDKVVTRCLSFAASLLETTLQWLICPVLRLFTFIKDKVISSNSNPTSSTKHAYQLISNKLIPRLYDALDVPKAKSDEIMNKLLVEESFKSVEELPLEVTVYFLIKYIDRLEEYALEQC